MGVQARIQGGKREREIKNAREYKRECVRDRARENERLRERKREKERVSGQNSK